MSCLPLLRRVLAAALLVGAAAPALAATFLVNDSGDAGDQDAGDGVCATAGGVCTLRAAIQQANASGTATTHRIHFDASVASITLTSPLPTIQVPLEIDGNRVGADPMNPRVDINGNGVSGGFSFIDTASQAFDPSPPSGAPQSGLFNLVVRGFNGDGISLSGRGMTVQNCYVGVMPNGSAASANTGHGISISAPPPAAALPDLPDLGGLDLGNVEAIATFLYAALAAANAPTVIQDNLISGNGLDGVRISGQHTAMVFVRGNRIGTSADGSAAIPNAALGQGSGVQLVGNTFANFIGPFNLISGNTRTGSAANGVFVNTGAVRFPNFVAGNLIGPGGNINPLGFDPANPAITDVLEFGNLENGIRVDARRAMDAPANPTPYSVIIGPANVISFNGNATPNNDAMNADANAGVLITGNSADTWTFGNFIGGLRFEIGGNVQLLGGNRGDGIQITTANHRIGGDTLVERNVISGNGRHGITVRGSTTRNVIIEGNLLGRDLLDLLPLGNGGDGIHVHAANMLTIGGSGPDAGNTISASVRNGVRISDASSRAVRLSHNSIHGNGTGMNGIGIDLERTAHAPDPVNGLPAFPVNFANRGQNSAVICDGQPAAPAACAGRAAPQYLIGGNQLQASFVLQSSQPDATYRAEVFLVDMPGPGGNGEGRVFVGASDFVTDAAGDALVDLALTAPAGGAGGMFMSMTVTDLTDTALPDGSTGPAANTSEFSAAVPVSTPGVIAFSMAMLDFGDVATNAHADLPVMLAHVDGDAVNDIDLVLTGDGYAIQASTCGTPPFALAIGASCTLTLRFAPSATGAAAGMLDATATVGTGDSLALAGTGVAPGSLMLADPALSFADVVVGSNATLMTTLSNPGGVAVTGIVLDVTGTGFSRDGGTCPGNGFALDAGAQCTIGVRFAPMAAGAAAGMLTAGGADVAAASATLDGNGLAPAQLAFTSAHYDFGNVVVNQTGILTATLINAGQVDAQDVLVSITGAAFERLNGSCGNGMFTLAAGSSCEVVVRMQPMSAGAQAGTIGAVGTGGLTAEATLGGMGIAAGDLVFDPGMLDFGDVDVGTAGTLQITLRNTGGASVDAITLVTTGGGFARTAGGTCEQGSFDLAGGADCTVEMRFEPTMTGAANGMLTADAAQATVVAALVGNGVGAPQLLLDPPSHAFGARVIGSDTDVVATLHNSGNVDATQVQIAVTGTGFSAVGGSCGMAAFTLAANANCTVTLRFSPPSSGAFVGSIDVVGDGGVNASAALSGTGLAPAALAFDAAAYDFGAVTIGTGSQRTATLSNPGEVAAQAVQIVVGGAGFSRNGAGSCGQAAFDLAAGASCTVVLDFDPAMAGVAAGTLAANASGGLSADAVLGGQGLAPGDLVFAPAQLSFGEHVVGSATTLTATLSNTGGSTITDITLTLSGAPFTRVAGSCPMGSFALDAGAACTVELQFAPTVAGAAGGQVLAASASASVSLPLTGTGLAPAAIAFAQPSYDFGTLTVGAQAERTVVLGNSGSLPADAVELAVTGAGFSRTGGSCGAMPFSLAAGAQCTVIVRLDAAGAGAAVGTVVATAAGGLSASTDLGGNVIDAGALSFAPAVLAFGEVGLNAQAQLMTTLTNTGGSAIDDIGLAFSGAGFSRDGGSCAAGMFSLAAGASCTVGVRFAPQVAGAADGNLVATAPGVAAAVVLSGQGQAAATPAASLEPGSLAFGGVAVGTSSASQSLTLRNTGGAPLTGIQITVPAPYAISMNACGATLAAGASCVVSLRFVPIVVGASAAQLSVTADGGIEASASLSGNGLGGSAAVQAVTIPTLGQWGLLMLMLTFAAFAAWRLRAQA